MTFGPSIDKNYFVRYAFGSRETKMILYSMILYSDDPLFDESRDVLSEKDLSLPQQRSEMQFAMNKSALIVKKPLSIS